MTKTMFILYRIAYAAPARKSYLIGLLFTHKNGCGGAISVTWRSVKWRVTYRIGVHTKQDSRLAEPKWLEWVMKSATHHRKNNNKKSNNNMHMNLDMSYYQKLAGSKTGYAGNKICPPPHHFTKAITTCFSLTQVYGSWAVLLKWFKFYKQRSLFPVQIGIDAWFDVRYRIGPFEVESALIEHNAVAEAAVVSSPDPVRGEVSKQLFSVTLLLSCVGNPPVHIISHFNLITFTW